MYADAAAAACVSSTVIEGTHRADAAGVPVCWCMCACMLYTMLWEGGGGGEEEKKKGERDGKHLFPISSFVPTVAAAGGRGPMNARDGQKNESSRDWFLSPLLFHLGHFWGP